MERGFGAEIEYGFQIKPNPQGDDEPTFLRSPETREEMGQFLRQPLPFGLTILGTYLSNGGRLYDDHYHVEYCTPLVRTIREVVARQLEGDKIVAAMCDYATQPHTDGVGFSQRALFCRHRTPQTR
jgi:hypothetical protein